MACLMLITARLALGCIFQGLLHLEELLMLLTCYALCSFFFLLMELKGNYWNELYAVGLESFLVA